MNIDGNLGATASFADPTALRNYSFAEIFPTHGIDVLAVTMSPRNAILAQELEEFLPQFSFLYFSLLNAYKELVCVHVVVCILFVLHVMLMVESESRHTEKRAAHRSNSQMRHANGANRRLSPRACSRRRDPVFFPSFCYQYLTATAPNDLEGPSVRSCGSHHSSGTPAELHGAYTRRQRTSPRLIELGIGRPALSFDHAIDSLIAKV